LLIVDPANFTKVIDHNKIYVKRNSNNNNITNTNAQKSKKDKEKERLYEMLKSKQDSKKSTSRSKVAEQNKENKTQVSEKNLKTETEKGNFSGKDKNIFIDNRKKKVKRREPRQSF
jgi:hypothetical protein